MVRKSQFGGKDEGILKKIKGKISPNLLQRVNTKRFVFTLIIWSFFVIAAMRPQWVGTPSEIPLSGRSVMLAVDLSGSMKEKDFKFNSYNLSRLQVVKSVLSPFIKRRKGDLL